MIAVLNWALDHWFLFFILSILGVFEGIRDFFIGIAQAIGGIGDRRHERRMEELSLRHQVGNNPELVPAKTPGPCVHRNVTPVVAAEEVVAWLCRTCDTKLPADWAIRAEDL